MTTCSCPVDSMESSCNINDFLIAYIQDTLNPTSISRLGRIAQKFLLDDPIDGDIHLMKHFEDVVSFATSGNYYLGYADTSITAYTSPSSGNYYDNYWAQNMSWNGLLGDAFGSLCAYNGGHCQAVVFEVVAFEGYEKVALGMNKYEVRLNQFIENPAMIYDASIADNVTQASCVDSITQSAALAGLAAKPPVVLIQSYFSCHTTTDAAFFQSIGNAAASAQLYLSFVFTAMGILFSIYYSRSPAAKSYQLLKAQKKQQLMEKYVELKEQSLQDLMIAHAKVSLDLARQAGKPVANLEEFESALSGAEKMLRCEVPDAGEKEYPAFSTVITGVDSESEPSLFAHNPNRSWDDFAKQWTGSR